jgi:hypothetical protein
MNAMPFCIECGGTLWSLASPGKDDLTRIVSLYGQPDRDLSSDAVSIGASTKRTLEYSSAGVLFTFTSGGVEASVSRWSLLIITDLRSQYVLTAQAAAQRLLR